MLVHTVPPQFGDLPVEEFRGLLIGVVKEREAEVRRGFAESGRTFLGVKGVMKQSPFGSPKTRALRRRLNPRLAGKDKERRLALIAQLKAFYEAYREAWRAFCAGVRDVVFPAGTYQMRVVHGASVEPTTVPWAVAQPP